MSPIVERLRHDNESVYKIFLIIFGVFYWLFLLGIFLAALAKHQNMLVFDYFLYGIGIPAFFLISAALYRARAYGNMILLGPAQCPALYQAVVEGAERLGLPTPTAFMYNSNGVMNAFARRLLGGRFVFLTSALVEVQDDAQIRFVIGHELGHHAAGHLDPVKNIIMLPGHFVPFLGKAYSRTREYTCDNIGAFLCGDTTAAQTSLQMLGCGCRRLNGTLNCEAFVAQEQMVPPIAGYVAEIFRTHPRLTRRVLALRSEQRVD